MGEVSVAIPVMNEEEKIGQCLEAVFSQSPKAHEVTMVEGHSTDGTFEGTYTKQQRTDNNNNTKEVYKIG